MENAGPQTEASVFGWFQKCPGSTSGCLQTTYRGGNFSASPHPKRLVIGPQHQFVCTAATMRPQLSPARSCFRQGFRQVINFGYPVALSGTSEKVRECCFSIQMPCCHARAHVMLSACCRRLFKAGHLECQFLQVAQVEKQSHLNQRVFCSHACKAPDFVTSPSWSSCHQRSHMVLKMCARTCLQCLQRQWLLQLPGPSVRVAGNGLPGWALQGYITLLNYLILSGD